MSKNYPSGTCPQMAFEVVELVHGDPKPLAVKASSIGDIVVGLSAKTAANWRSQGIGPPYITIHGQVYYLYETLKDFFGGKEFKTHNQN